MVSSFYTPGHDSKGKRGTKTLCRKYEAENAGGRDESVHREGQNRDQKTSRCGKSLRGSDTEVYTRRGRVQKRTEANKHSIMSIETGWSNVRDKRSDLTIGYLNCQSIGNKSASLTNIIAEHDLDAFAVVETFHESSEDITLARITPDGYTCVDRARERKRSVRSTEQKMQSFGAVSGRQRRGGVAWICKESCKARRMDLHSKAGTFEFISVMLTLRGVKTIAVAVYRPGSERVSDQFLEDFSQMLEELIVYSCHILVVGDVNIHLDKSDDVWTMKFNTIVDCFGLVQNISSPTHKAGHTLDVVITKGPVSHLLLFARYTFHLCPIILSSFQDCHS